MRTVGSTPFEADAASSRELPRVFWVNQGFNYDKEREGGFVRAPQKNSSGGEFSHWKRVSELKPGDLLIHYAKRVRALGRVTAEAFVTGNSEWQAAVEYFPLKEPIALEDVMADFLRIIQPSSGPITVKRSIKQGYLWDFNAEGLALLKTYSHEQWPSWADAPARDQRVQQWLKNLVGTENQSLSSTPPPLHTDQEFPPAYGSDVAIITVIQPELFAALEALNIPESQREKDSQGTVYFRGSLRSQMTGRDYRLVVTCVGGAGNYDASAAAYDVIVHHRPRVLILMGIAAGIQGKVRIGEVVLSERVVAYEPGAIVSPDDGGASTQEHRPEIDRLSHSMSQDVITYRPDSSRLNARFRALGGESPAAPAGNEEEFRNRVASTITARAATIASGEKLLRDPAKLRAIRQEQHGKVEVGEMEAAGLVAASRRANIPWLVIRGISDFGDSFKDDRFHHFASRAAAVVLADFLAHGLTLPESPPTVSTSLNPAITPQYPDAQTRQLVGQIEGARTRKKRLQASGANTSQVDQEILSLRRQLREGGQLRAGGWLGHGDRYLLIEAIGRGGFGTIWKAIDQKTQTIVAIKVLHTNLAGDPDRRDRFFRGARRMAELQHPAVVRVLEQHGEEGGFHFFVMEYVAGGNLRQGVLQRVVTPDKIVSIILRIGEPLALGHSNGIIHRDVKPANILLDEQACPLLTDFDLVGAVDTTGGTRTGALGTLVYAAPECLDRPQDADARADVYGLGMTAIFGFYGAELPFHQIMRSPERFLDQLSCPPLIKSVLRRATSLERVERYKDAGEFIADLQRAQKAPEIRTSIHGSQAATPHASPIRILHLSDLHVGAGVDPMTLLQTLVADLRDPSDLMVDHLDYVVISGDLTLRATPQEFEQARQFVSALLQEFGLTSQRCIIVPGNHDLDWDTEVYTWKKKRQVNVGLLAPGSFIEAGDGYNIRDEERYPERFKNFSEHFYHPLFQQAYPLDPKEQCLSFLFGESRLQFLAMNSAWEIDEYFPERSSIFDEALTRGLISAEKQLTQAQNRGELADTDEVLRLSVRHHPITGNEEMPQDVFTTQLQQAGVRFVLHGHVHEDRADLISYTDPSRQVHVIGAGSFGAPIHHRREAVPRLYNLLEVARDHSHVRVHTRVLQRGGRAWEGHAVWPDTQSGVRRTYYVVKLR